ncbi:MAG: hypothetical protein IJ292_01390 [Clostridia bacterium]|nr:hypothetical protein [Clostridia bacterium]
MKNKNTKKKPTKAVLPPEKPFIPYDYVPDKINQRSLDKAYNLLKKYKSGKTNLEKRIIENDLWWKMRHWEQIRDRDRKYYPASAWLFNAIANKHADVMDNCPEGIVLPREKSDSDAAKQLTDILPVILEQNSFEELYSDVWYDKLKGGTGVYGIFWDPSLNNGTGDIAIKRCDVLNLFWEPGVSDIQSSPHLFHVELFNNDELESKYPSLHGKLGQNGFDVTKYRYDDAVDTGNKTPVIDWYYKTSYNGKTLLHLCKFCADEILYSSENDITLYNRGYYDHGLYPFIFDKLYVEQGTPCGFGFIDVMKDTQTQIDLMSASVCENIRMASTVRYFARGDGSVNEREFADWTNPIVHYTGSGNPNDSMIPIRIPEMPSLYVSFINNKINELKETSGNSDFTRGNTASGVTAASAIAALQEAGSKLSRDMIKGSYNVFVKINNLIIELIRQFYDLPRCFRITGENGEYEFVSYTNKMLLPQNMGNSFGFDLGNRLPVFDIKVKAQKQTAFSKLSQNELAKEFYGLGFFEPARADSALACLDMMEFEGKNILAEKINERNTFANNYSEMYSKLLDLASIIEKEHPELSGIYNAFEHKYSPEQKGKNQTRRTPNISFKKGSSNIKNARQRATSAATPK